MKNESSKQVQKQALRKTDVMRFYFKVNNSKLQDEIRLKNQIEKVVKRLVERNNIRSKSVELFFGTVNDDFAFDRCRLRISFNCT